MAEDVWFNADMSSTTVKDHVTESPAIAALPEVFGSGNVRNLRQAACSSTALASLVADTEKTVTHADLWNKLDDLIASWAATSDMQTSIEKADSEGFGPLVYLFPGQRLEDREKRMRN